MAAERQRMKEDNLIQREDLEKPQNRKIIWKRVTTAKGITTKHYWCVVVIVLAVDDQVEADERR